MKSLKILLLFMCMFTINIIVQSSLMANKAGPGTEQTIITETNSTKISDSMDVVILPQIVFTGQEKTLQDTISTIIQQPEYQNINEILLDAKTLLDKYKELKEGDSNWLDWFNFINILILCLVALFTFILTKILPNKKKNYSKKE